MKSIDTNVLIRFLVNDDARQGEKARSILLGAEKKGEAFLVTDPVLLEILYVLGSVYEYTRSEILDALEALTLMPVLSFEKIQVLQDLVIQGRKTRIGLEDLFIGLVSRESGCVTTITFDKRAAKSELFSLIG